MQSPKHDYLDYLVTAHLPTTDHPHYAARVEALSARAALALGKSRYIRSGNWLRRHTNDLDWAVTAVPLTPAAAGPK